MKLNTIFNLFDVVEFNDGSFGLITRVVKTKIVRENDLNHKYIYPFFAHGIPGLRDNPICGSFYANDVKRIVDLSELKQEQISFIEKAKTLNIEMCVEDYHLFNDEFVEKGGPE